MSKALALLALGVGGYLATNAIKSLLMVNRSYSDEVPTEPPGNVSIIVPGWMESPDRVERSLESLRNQSIIQFYPNLCEIIFVGCQGIDQDQVRLYADRVLCAPRGKLNAREIGINESKGDIIISVDADTFYPPNSLNLLLQPFWNPGVVASSGTTWLGGFETIASFPKEFYYRTLISGRCSAFWKWAYYDSGGFDLEIDQTDMQTIRAEEEFGFRKRLEMLGSVAFVDTSVIHLAENQGGRGVKARDVVNEYQ